MTNLPPPIPPTQAEQVSKLLSIVQSMTLTPADGIELLVHLVFAMHRIYCQSPMEDFISQLSADLRNLENANPREPATPTN